MMSPPKGCMWRVVDWNSIYENNRSREIKGINWVPIPIHMDGDGYTELLDHEDGAAHYGAWIALICVASRTKVRGTLQRDAGLPHDGAALARISRIPAKCFESAIPRFISIGWLEVVDIATGCVVSQDGAVIPQDGAALEPQEGAPRARAERKKEQKEEKERTEQKEGAEMENRAERSAAFDEHFQEYKRLCRVAGEHGCLIGGDSNSWMHAWYAWTALDPSQRIAAIDGIRRRVDAEAWEDSILKSLPNNILAKKNWDRPMAPASNGRKLSRYEEMLRDA